MQPLTSVCPDGETRWLVDVDLVKQLIGAEGFRLRQWQASGQLQIVKTGRHRTVYRLQIDAGCFYLKRYRVSDWKAFLQNVLRPPKAVLEWKAALRVAAVGVSTFETVAVGRTVVRGFAFDSYLATRSIDHAEQLDTFVSRRLPQYPPRQRAVIRRHLAEELGSLAATLHRGRLLHRDLHAGNILIRIEADERVRLWLIDLHAVSGCRRLTLRQIESNLSLLSPFFVRHTTTVDRVRFFRAYWNVLLAGPDSRTTPPRHLIHSAEQSIAKRLAVYSHKHVVRTNRKHDRKWVLGNRRLIIADKKNISCRGLASLDRSSIIQFRDDPEAPFADADSHGLPDGSDCRRLASLTLPRDGQTVDCTIEAFQRPRQSRWWKIGQRYSEVRRAWEIGHAFLRRCIATAKPLMFVEISSDDTSRQYIVTETISNAQSLQDFLQRDRRSHSEQFGIGCLAEMGSRLARQLQRIHTAGFDHPTVTAKTILVEKTRERQQIWFVSLENVLQRRRLLHRHIVTSLASLNASLLSCDSIPMTHRLRFLKHYLKDRAVEQWRPWWREIQRETIRKLEAGNRHSTDETDSITTVEHPLRRTA